MIVSDDLRSSISASINMERVLIFYKRSVEPVSSSNCLHRLRRDVSLTFVIYEQKLYATGIV